VICGGVNSLEGQGSDDGQHLRPEIRSFVNRAYISRAKQILPGESDLPAGTRSMRKRLHENQTEGKWA
jgi:hypothetical protein